MNSTSSGCTFSSISPLVSTVIYSERLRGIFGDGASGSPLSISRRPGAPRAACFTLVAAGMSHTRKRGGNHQYSRGSHPCGVLGCGVSGGFGRNTRSRVAAKQRGRGNARLKRLHPYTCCCAPAPHTHTHTHTHITEKKNIASSSIPCL